MAETKEPAHKDGSASAPAGDVKSAEGKPPGAKTGDSLKEASKESPKEKAMAKLSAFKGFGAGAMGKLKGGLLAFLLLPVTLVKSVFGALFAGGLGSRLLMLGFLASLGLLISTSLELYTRYLGGFVAQWSSKRGSAKENDDALNSFLKSQKEITIAAANMVFLERFTASIESASPSSRAFEIELYVECDAPETSRFLRSHVEGVREAVSSAIQGQSYKELISEAGKDRLKTKIAEALTRALGKWGAQGSIQRVFFTKFVMG